MKRDKWTKPHRTDCVTLNDIFSSCVGWKTSFSFTTVAGCTFSSGTLISRWRVRQKCCALLSKRRFRFRFVVRQTETTFVDFRRPRHSVVADTRETLTCLRPSALSIQYSFFGSFAEESIARSLLLADASGKKSWLRREASRHWCLLWWGAPAIFLFPNLERSNHQVQVPAGSRSQPHRKRAMGLPLVRAPREFDVFMNSNSPCCLWLVPKRYAIDSITACLHCRSSALSPRQAKLRWVGFLQYWTCLHQGSEVGLGDCSSSGASKLLWT